VTITFDNDVFLPAGRVRDRYNVSDMSLYRWLHDEKLSFPRPIYIGRYRYWRLADLLAWEQSRPQQGGKHAA
jgi:predicted DNA-binding transcriptional regulator AlpA